MNPNNIICDINSTAGGTTSTASGGGGTVSNPAPKNCPRRVTSPPYDLIERKFRVVQIVPHDTILLYPECCILFIFGEFWGYLDCFIIFWILMIGQMILQDGLISIRYL